MPANQKEVGEQHRLPTTREELRTWIREVLGFPQSTEEQLHLGFDHFLAHRDKESEQSKQEAIQAVMAGLARKIHQLKKDLTTRDQSYEEIIAELIESLNKDSITQLLNRRRFIEKLERYFSIEQPGEFCGIGIVDVDFMKTYNDTLGHAVGDKILEEVGRLLRETARSDSSIAYLEEQRGFERRKLAREVSAEEERRHEERRQIDAPPQELHARYGGDEYSFLIPNLNSFEACERAAERFRYAIQEYDWTTVDSRLAARPVEVSVGAVCFRLGSAAVRRSMTQELSQMLLKKADERMYKAKHQSRVDAVCMHLEGSQLVEIDSTV
jgi:GGDEF domain-containing protein